MIEYLWALLRELWTFLSANFDPVDQVGVIRIKKFQRSPTGLQQQPTPLG